MCDSYFVRTHTLDMFSLSSFSCSCGWCVCGESLCAVSVKCVWLCGWMRPEDDAKCPPSLLFHLCFWDPEPRTAWLASKLPFWTWFYSLSSSIEDTSCTAQHLQKCSLLFTSFIVSHPRIQLGSCKMLTFP